MRRGSSPLSFLIIIGIIGGMLIFVSADEAVTSFKSPVDINELTANELVGNLKIDTEIYSILDCFANEESWTENKDGSRTPSKTSRQYYIIPIGEEEYMALEAKPEKFKKYDEIMEDTYNYIVGDSDSLGVKPEKFLGYTKKLDEELDRYLLEWFQDTEFLNTTDETEIRQYISSYMLVPTDFKASRVMLGIGIICILAVIAVISILLIVKKKQNSRQMDMYS